MRSSERYIAAVRRWMRFIIREPNALLAASAWFVLTSLPIVTLGPARLALARYMDERERGIKCSWRACCAFAFRECGARAWAMGFSDALAAALALGAFLGLTQGELPVALRVVYALLLVLDALYLLSAVYRYPALRSEPQRPVTLIMLRGALMALGDPGWTLMFNFARLMALIICAVTGVGIFLLFPAASSLMSVCAYHEMAEKYAPKEEA